MPEMVFEYILKQKGIDPEKDLTINQSIDFQHFPTLGRGDYGRIAFQESLGEFPGHQLSEKNPGHVTDRTLVAARVIADLVPEFLDSWAELRHRHARLEIHQNRNFSAIDDGLDGIAADIETCRALDSSVGEIQVPLHVLNDIAVDQQADSHIFELDAAEKCPGLGQ